MPRKLVSKGIAFFYRYGFSLIVVVPTVFALVYSLVFAHNRYVCESQVIVRENKSGGVAPIPGLALGLLGSQSTSVEDAYILQDYLKSPGFLDKFDAEFNLRQHYGSPSLDFQNRLSSSASREDFLEYYRDKIAVSISAESTIVSLRATAFDPETALAMNEFMLQESEAQINELNRVMARAKTQFAEKELKQAQAILLESEQELLKFQHEKGLVDANSEATSLFSRISALEAEKTAKEAELKRLRQFMREDTIPVLAIQQEIEAIERQLHEEDAELSGSDEGSMVPMLLQYQHLRMKMEFAAQAYTSAFAALETSKLEVARQEKFILIVSNPVLPEEADGPRPLKDTMTVFVIALMLFGILRLSVATVSDHTV